MRCSHRRSYVSRQYTILTARRPFRHFCGQLRRHQSIAEFSHELSYDATHAYLNLILNFSARMAERQQQAVGNALTNLFNSTGSIPRVAFASLSATGLTQVSGETATGSQQTTFNAMTSSWAC